MEPSCAKAVEAVLRVRATRSDLDKEEKRRWFIDSSRIA